MKKRTWVSSGVVEDLDARQARFLELVLSKIREYYRDHHMTANKYRHPMSLSCLSKLCGRSNVTVLSAVRMLANLVGERERVPAVFYDRIGSQRNRVHRPYRIFLRT